MAYKAKKWENVVYDELGNVLRKGSPIMAEDLNRIDGGVESLMLDRHTHTNQDVLDQLVQAVIDNSHNHLNGLALDRLTQEHIDNIENNTLLVEKHEEDIKGLVSNLSNLKLQVVENIAQRDLIENRESIVHVIDASLDTTVETGWAQYIWQTDKWVKIAEKESLDVLLNWTSIQDKPLAFKPEKHNHAYSEIGTLATDALNWDIAFNKSHSHTNKTVLDKIVQEHLDNIASAMTRIGNLEEGSSQLHIHTNKLILDKITQAMLNDIHTHTNKLVLDKLTQAVIDNSHLHSNGTVLETITQEMLDKIHEHSNKTVLDKVRYSGTKATIDLNEIEEVKTGLENHTHNYSDLIGKPTIPTKTSQLQNDSSFIKGNTGRIHISYTESDIPSDLEVNDIVIKVI